MHDAPQLKLVDLTRNPLDPIPLERRNDVRHRVTGRVTALLSQTEEGQTYSRICSLRMVDMSATGLGVFCQEELPLNSTVTVFIPPHGPERGFDLHGKIVRCHNKGGGYEIGIRHDQRVMAA